MSPEMAKALSKPVDLDWVGGYNSEASVLDEQRLRANVTQVLAWRRYPDDFEAHFTMLCALSGVPYFNPSDELMDWIDEQLSDYILTCRSDDNEAGANFMLCDLILDHWPEDRAIKLVTLTLEHCRYLHRVQQILSWVAVHRDDLSPRIERAIRSLGISFMQDRDPARQCLGLEMVRILAPVPEGEYVSSPRIKRLHSGNV
jgi:hypothetical protein